MDFGLHWFRRQQRDLARAALALFCAAWLQAAVVPCVMAAVPDDSRSVLDARSTDATAGQSVQPVHDDCGRDAVAREVHCPYCPPGEHVGGAGSCDTRAACAYPHDPRVDARAALTHLPALPVAYLGPSPAPVVIVREKGRDAPETVPRVRLPVSYCRFIE